MIVALLFVVILAVLFPGFLRLVLTLLALGFCVAVGYGGYVESHQDNAPAYARQAGAPTR